MNRVFFSYMALIAVLVIAIEAVAQAPVASFDVAVENPAPFERTDEVVTLAWADVVARLGDRSANTVRVVDAASGQERPVQAVDGDGDGDLDELLFLVNLWPREVRRFRVEAAPPTNAFPSRVHATHEPRRDDVAWESDRIAFRTYGQGLWGLEDLVSSGVDVWVKRVDDLVIDRWYALEDGDYHTDTGEGADFFSVGPTLGNGGNAVWIDGALHRPANFARHRILADGPIRTIFELEYDAWDAGGRSFTQTRRIAMDVGQNLYHEELTFQSPNPAPFEYAVGFVKRPEGLVGSTRSDSAHAWLSVWGAFGRQSGGHGELGGAVVLPRDRVLDIRETQDHFIVRSRALPGETYAHHVGAGWTASGQFDSVEDWWAHLDALARRLAIPVSITIAD